MPNSENKPLSNRKRVLSYEESKEYYGPSGKKTAKKQLPEDSIEKSKQWISKLQVKKITRSSRRQCLMSDQTKNPNSKVCINRKPLPSLAELEKMFDDSEDDKEAASSTKLCHPERPATLEQTVPLLDTVISPQTDRKIENKILDLLPNIPEQIIIDLINEPCEPAQPVIPVKRPKKSGISYIVGCNDCPQIPQKLNTSFCKGHYDYGISNNSNDEQCLGPKKRKTGTKLNVPKSIFNAHSDEIATHLKETADREPLSDGSNDSTSTISYDFNLNSLSNKRTPSFSPLPSTSKDNDTFLKNDQLLHESLLEDTTSNYKTQNNNLLGERPESTVLDESSLTITENDEAALKHTKSDSLLEEEESILPESPLNKRREDEIEIIQPRYQTVVITDYFTSVKKILDDAIAIVDVDDDNRTADNCEIVDLDSYDNNNDLYSTINCNSSYDSECEVIDVDSVLAENQALIEKYRKTVIDFDSVTNVVPNTSANNFRNTQVKTNVENARFNKPTVNKHSIANNAEHSISNNAEHSISNNAEHSISNNAEHSISNNAEHSIFNNVERLSSITEDNSDKTIFGIVKSFFNSYFGKNDNIPTTSANLHLSSNNRLDQSNSALRFNFNMIQSPTTIPVAISSNVTSTGNDSVIIVEQDSVPTISQINFTNNRTQSPPQTQQVRSIGDCPICMDNLSNKAIASTVCGHLFCMECIKAAIKNNGKKCPNCRKPLKGAGGGYHQIFL